MAILKNGTKTQIIATLTFIIELGCGSVGFHTDGDTSILAPRFLLLGFLTRSAVQHFFLISASFLFDAFVRIVCLNASRL